MLWSLCCHKQTLSQRYQHPHMQLPRTTGHSCLRVSARHRRSKSGRGSKRHGLCWCAATRAWSW